jgi:hypothetical protein
MFLVGFEQMAQMPFAEHNNMVKTMPGHEYPRFSVCSLAG